MSTLMSRSLAFGSALLLAVASPTRLAAQVPLVPGGPWAVFEWFLGVGPVEGSGFTVTAAQPVRIRVTDGFVSGDAFDVFVGALLAASTPSVPGGIFTGAATGDDAWAEPALSKTELVLAPGNYLITLAVREAGSGFDFGEGFIRADLVQVGVVPEPASVALLATGLAGLAGLRFRGRHFRGRRRTG